jgi:hypothetical protein
MNILVDELPTRVKVGDKVYKIVTDFRTCLKIILAFEDPEIAMYEKNIIMLELMYPVIPTNIEEALKQGIKFLNGGKEVISTTEPGLRVYSFSKDANFIFAAFRQTHGIDLEKMNMHWWKFLALFMDLGSETAFCSMVNIRKRIKTGEATKEERHMAREMEEVFGLPEDDNNLTIEEREAEAIFNQSLKVKNG